MTTAQLQAATRHNLTPYEFFVMEKKWRKATKRLTAKSFSNFVNLFANKGYQCNPITDNYRHLPAWSNSALGVVALQVKDLEYKGPERAFTFGSAVHEMFLENEIFDIEEFNLRKSEMRTIQEIHTKLWANEFFRELVTKGECEKPIFWQDDTTQLPCKGKVDILYQNMLFDLKTTAATTDEDFRKSFKKYDYDRQAAYYIDGSGANSMTFIALSKFKPFNIFLVQVKKSDDIYLMGRRKYKFLLQKTIELKLIP